MTTDEHRVLPHNRCAAQAWSSGGDAYDEISRQVADAIEHCVDRLDPRPGQRVLDVATGTGWTARRIAARGADVHGVDFGEDVITAARRRAIAGTEFSVADAEQLPFEAGSFDAVVSTFGVMFCARPEPAAAELARVCKPGGRLALTTWTPTGFVSEVFRLIASYRPDRPVDAPSPFGWGDTGRVTELLGDAFELAFEHAVSYYRGRDETAAWHAFSTGFGPVVTLKQQLPAAQIEQLRTEFEALHARFRTSVGLLVEREYMVTVGTKRS